MAESNKDNSKNSSDSPQNIPAESHKNNSKNNSDSPKTIPAENTKKIQRTKTLSGSLYLLKELKDKDCLKD